MRDIPDVSFFASHGSLSSSAYLICVSEGGYSCTYNSTSEPTAQEVGGTSVATPAMAGVMALINQKTGSIQGNPNAELYKLASKQTYSNCSCGDSHDKQQLLLQRHRSGHERHGLRLWI